MPSDKVRFAVSDLIKRMEPNQSGWYQDAEIPVEFRDLSQDEILTAVPYARQQMISMQADMLRYAHELEDVIEIYQKRRAAFFMTRAAAIRSIDLGDGPETLGHQAEVVPEALVRRAMDLSTKET